MDNNDFNRNETAENGTFFTEGDAPNTNDGENGGYAFEQITIEKPKTMAYAVIALLSGILSVLCCCTGFGGLFFGIVSVVFVIISKKHLGYFDTKATIGLIFAIFGLLFSVFELIMTFTVLNNEAYWAEILEMLEQYGEAGSTDPNFSV